MGEDDNDLSELRPLDIFGYPEEERQSKFQYILDYLEVERVKH
jgi:hypothetical protein